MPAKKKTTRKRKADEEEKELDIEEETHRPRAIERRVSKRFAKLNPIGFGIGWGIIGALFITLITLAGMFGYFTMTYSLLLDMYGPFGYSISVLGILLGAIYGFIDCFIISALFAAIYNALS